MKVLESGEDYLETILILQQRGGTVRSVDVAAKMKVSKASVSVAMKNLRAGGYVKMGNNHEIVLTPQGRQLAETIYERHQLFSDILYGLGVDGEVALRDACRIEHALSAESFKALKGYFLKTGVDPPEKEKWTGDAQKT